jgi:dipeptidyl-peptidase-3
MDDLQKISTVSKVAVGLFQEFSSSILARPPYNLGFPSDIAQSAYYSGMSRVNHNEVNRITKIMEGNSISPENTRLRKHDSNEKPSFDILQASVEADGLAQELSYHDSGESVRLVRGDHSQELKKICECLEEALHYVANPLQEQTLSKYLESFRTGDMEAYKESQRVWVKDMKPPVESILGFVEPYRDPFGVRAEFEGLVGIVDAEETNVLTVLVENSTNFIRRLPWAKGCKENDGKGPFEKDLFDPPDFTSLHGNNRIFQVGLDSHVNNSHSSCLLL